MSLDQLRTKTETSNQVEELEKISGGALGPCHLTLQVMTFGVQYMEFLCVNKQFVRTDFLFMLHTCLTSKN